MSPTRSNVKRDATPPTIHVDSPSDGAAYLLNAQVLADYACEDALSGIWECTGRRPSGEPVDTSTAGPNDFAVKARDKAGNELTVTNRFTAQYSFDGFYQPIDDPPVVNSLVAGRQVPVRWRLVDANGTVVTDLGAIWGLHSTQVPCGEGAPFDEIEANADFETDVIGYDASSKTFTAKWSTSTAWRGTCRKMQLALGDRQVKEALFQFR